MIYERSLFQLRFLTSRTCTITLSYNIELNLFSAKHESIASISIQITGKIVILVDDVLFKGCDIRVTMNVLINIGRLQYVNLSVLLERCHGEVTIKADCA